MPAIYDGSLRQYLIQLSLEEVGRLVQDSVLEKELSADNREGLGNIENVAIYYVPQGDPLAVEDQVKLNLFVLSPSSLSFLVCFI
jgi:hypothetical protein